MSHMHNLNFPDTMFALSLLHNIEDSLGRKSSIKCKN